jgi:hypothetical protein
MVGYRWSPLAERQLLLLGTFKTMERGRPGDFHPISNEWGGAWVVPSQVRVVWPSLGKKKKKSSFPYFLSV